MVSRRYTNPSDRRQRAERGPLRDWIQSTLVLAPARHAGARLLCQIGLLILTGLGYAATASAQSYNWVTLSGGSPGQTAAGVTRQLSWQWAPGGVAINGTVALRRTGAGVTYTYSESHAATITDSGFSAFQYNNSAVTVARGGVNGIFHFGSIGEYGRAPDDVADGNASTTTVDFSFDGTVSSPANTLISLFDPGAGAATSPFVYTFKAFFQGAPVDTSSWTIEVVDPYTPAGTPANWSWNAAAGTYTLTSFPSAAGGNFPDTLVFINSQDTTFDRLTVNSQGVAVDNFAIGIGANTVPSLPLSLNKIWDDGNPGDQVTLTLSGAGVDNATTGSSSFPTPTTLATAEGIVGQIVNLAEVFNGSANPANYTITWACLRNDNDQLVASGTGTSGSFTMPNIGVDCSFSNVFDAELPRIRLQKQLPQGRYAETDQFTLSLSGAGGSSTASATTTGSGSTAEGEAKLAPALSDELYTLSEAAASDAQLTNYTTSYACSNANTTGTPDSSGTATSFTLTVQPDDDFTCVFSNTRAQIFDLSISKVAADTSAIDGGSISYSLTITNEGRDTVTNAVVTDTPDTELDCPGAGNSNELTCVGSGCAGPYTVSQLLDTGITLGTLTVGDSISLGMTCRLTL